MSTTAYIVMAWVVTFGAVGAYTASVIRRGRRLSKVSGADRTSLLVSTNETTGPGALHRLLGPLAKHGINLTRIESRPSQRRKWDYVFFIDIEGHVDEPNVAAALEGLKSQASLYRVLGSYPRAVL